MNPPDTEGVIVYSTREVLDSINEKLAKGQTAMEQLDRRVSGAEGRLAAHDKILTEQIPKFQKAIEELNVQKQVEDALDSRKVKGISRRDQVVTAAIGMLILALALLQYLPHLNAHHP